MAELALKLSPIEGSETQNITIKLYDSCVVVTNPNEDFSVLIGNDGNGILVNVIDAEDTSLADFLFEVENGEDETEQAFHLSDCGTQ